MSLDRVLAARVRSALLGAGFTVQGVRDRVGAEAFEALGRDLALPTRSALARARPAGVALDLRAAPDGVGARSGPEAARSLLDTLIRLFLLGERLPAGELPAELAADLATLGLIARDSERVTRLQDVRPYGEPDTDWYLVSDLGRPEQPDHVPGLGGASMTLARITPRGPVGRAWDLGTGAGVQALHAARHAGVVVATDVNPRAVRCARLTAALSGVPEVELREGSWFEPVAGESFDLIVANPPFVVSPGARFAYRDSGLAGDAASRLVVRGAADHLAPGGRAVILANWLHRRGQPWQERVSSWVAGASVAAWVVQRDVQDPLEYARTWLRDAGTHEADMAATAASWLDELAALDADAVGFGWVILGAPPQRTGGEERAWSPWLVVEDLSRSARLPDGAEVEVFLAGCERVERLGAADLLLADARLADGVRITRASLLTDGQEVREPPVLEVPGTVGPGGWRRSEPVPQTVLAALLDPAPEPLGVRLDRAAMEAGSEPLDVLPVALSRLRELVRVGIVRTDGPPPGGRLR